MASNHATDRLAPAAPIGTPPTQVFVVTSGCYSDYGIDSVWLTREEAEAVVGDQHDDGYGQRVEVYAIGENPRIVGTFWHHADIDPATGRVLDENVDDSATMSASRGVVSWQPRMGRLFVRVEQTTRERADKVFSELLASVTAALDAGLPPRAIASEEYTNGAWRRVDPLTVTIGDGASDRG